MSKSTVTRPSSALEACVQNFAHKHHQAYYFAARLLFGRRNRAYNKVFVIGDRKTGTTSLALCLTLLRFRHKSWDADLTRTYQTDSNLSALWPYADRFDSMDDRPWNLDDVYRALDQRYPNSRFILTVRNEAAWRRSHEQYFRKGSKHVPEEYWIDPYDSDHEWQLHQQRNERILNYFKDRRQDLLIYNISEQPGWEPLCHFLELPIPGFTFPHVNISGRAY